jgi:hypothetical protein
VLFAMAKPQNVFIAGLLGLASFRWAVDRRARLAATIGCSAVAASMAVSLLTAPVELKNSNTFNLVFLGILNESHDTSADLKALGLDPQLRDQRGLGAWSPGSLCPRLEAEGAIGRVVTLATVVKFYALRPARAWLHVRRLFSGMMFLRPELGNFEPSAGQPPGAHSRAFALWSDFHEYVLSRAAKFILFGLILFPITVLACRAAGAAGPDIWLDVVALLALSALIAFLTAAFGDAWENVKHMFLFNTLVDVWLLAVAGLSYSFAFVKQFSVSGEGLTSVVAKDRLLTHAAQYGRRP